MRSLALHNTLKKEFVVIMKKLMNQDWSYIDDKYVLTMLSFLILMVCIYFSNK